MYELMICTEDEDPDASVLCQTVYSPAGVPTDIFPTDAVFTVEPIGSLARTLVLPKPQVAISYSGGSMYFINAAPTGAPQKALFGDVQGSSYSSLINVNPFSVSFDHAIATCTTTQDGALCTATQSGVSKQRAIGANWTIPNMFNGVMWEVSENQFLVASDPQPGAVQVNLISTDLALIRNTNTVCVVLTDITDIGGSYGSNEAAWLTLTAYSSCTAGWCTLSSNDLIILTPAILLTTNPAGAEYLIRYQINTATSSGVTLTCSAVGSSATIDLEDHTFNAPSIDVGENDTITSVAGGPNGSPPGTIFLPDGWFSLDLGSQIGSVIGAVAGGIVALLAIGLIYYLCTKDPNPGNWPTIINNVVKYDNVGKDDEEMEELESDGYLSSKLNMAKQARLRNAQGLRV